MYYLKDLLKKLTYEVVCGSDDIYVKSVVNDSRKVSEESLFICIAGGAFDGHQFVEEVVEKGATVLVVERDIEIPKKDGITVIKVADTRYAMAFISAAYFGNPAEKLKVIGITGTKGKTTTTYLVKSILEHAGYKVGLIGLMTNIQSSIILIIS